MIIVKKCLAKKCKKYALNGINRPIHCDDHKNGNDISLIEQTCTKCSRIGVVDENGICWDYCIPTTIYNKLYKKRQTLKQNKIADFLKENIEMACLSIDKIIDTNCSLRRPDFVYDLGSHVVIIEVDENAGANSSYHKEKCEKEHIRMFEISNCFEGRPIIFIRYNPDVYTINGEIKNVYSTKRESILLKWMTKAINHQNFPQNNYFPTVLVVYLFYNDYTEKIIEFTELPQTNMTKGLFTCK